MVETYLNVDSQPTLLRIETTKEQKELSIPKFIDIIREVTKEQNYNSTKMAENAFKLPESDKKAIKEKLSELKKHSKPKITKVEKVQKVEI